MQNNTLLVDMKYAPLLAGRVRNFKAKGSNVYNCSCPICGDSHKKTTKARFYIYPKGVGLRVACHNCGYGARLSRFLKEQMPDVYQQYCFDLISEHKREAKSDPVILKQSTRREIEGGVLKGLRRISQLPALHFAKKYVSDRKLPTYSHASLYFTPNFSRWLNQLDPENIRQERVSDPRLVIPFINAKGEVFAVQGRALYDTPDRYLTHKFDPDHPKVFGLERVDPNRQVKVLEGPLDSFFPTNALGMAGADVTIDDLCTLLQTTRERLTFVFDNEPRNPHIVRRMKKYVREGVKMVVWPSTMMSKDVNQMVLDGVVDPTQVDLLIERRTYSGLEAQLQLALWSKV